MYDIVHVHSATEHADGTLSVEPPYCADGYLSIPDEVVVTVDVSG